jgi:lysophospholipase L1-like esterase
VFVGSYLRVKFHGTGVDIHVDTAGLSEYPWVGYRIDDGEDSVNLLTADQKVIRISRLPVGEHSLFVFYHARNNFNQRNTWADAQKLRILSLAFFGGRGILPSTARPLKGILYGDSITAGLACGAAPGVRCSDKYVNGATASYAYFLGNGLNADYDQAGCGGDGWTKGGVGGFPGFQNGWNYKKAGVARDLSQHDFVTIYHGCNDGKVPDSVVSSMMEKLRSANSNMWIFVMVPFSGRNKVAIVNGVADHLSKHPAETRIKVIDTSGVRIKTADGIHPTPAGAEVLAKFMTSSIKEYLAGESKTAPAAASFGKP